MVFVPTFRGYLSASANNLCDGEGKVVSLYPQPWQLSRNHIVLTILYWNDNYQYDPNIYTWFACIGNSFGSYSQTVTVTIVANNSSSTSSQSSSSSIDVSNSESSQSYNPTYDMEFYYTPYPECAKTDWVEIWLVDGLTRIRFASFKVYYAKTVFGCNTDYYSSSTSSSSSYIERWSSSSSSYVERWSSSSKSSSSHSVSSSSSSSSYVENWSTSSKSSSSSSSSSSTSYIINWTTSSSSSSSSTSSSSSVNSSSSIMGCDADYTGDSFTTYVEANGTYNFVGYYGGKPKYKNTVSGWYVQYEMMDSRWSIATDMGVIRYYGIDLPCPLWSPYKLLADDSPEGAIF